MHDINPRVQLLPDCRGEHIKLKLLASPSRWTYALLAFLAFSSKNRAFNSSSPSWIQGTQNFKETRGVSPRTQIKSIYSEEHIKWKLLINPSKIIFTLSQKLIISAKKLGSKGGKNTASADEKHTIEIRVLSSRIQIRSDSWAYQTKAQNIRFKLVVCKHDLSKYFEGGGSSRLRWRKSKNTAKAKRESLLRVDVYIYICCVCVCVREREREEKICSISQEPSYSTENKI